MSTCPCDRHPECPSCGQGRFVLVPAAYIYLLRDPGTGARGDIEVLLQLRANTGFMDGHWAAAAAGHVDEGESFAQAAQREAAEELGLSSVALEFATTLQRRHSPDPIDQRVDVFYTAHSWVGEPRIMEPAKCAELRWWPLGALPEPMPSHERFVLDRLRAGQIGPLVSLGFD